MRTGCSPDLSGRLDPVGVKTSVAETCLAYKLFDNSEGEK